MKVTFTRRFSAAHRIPSDPGKCHRIHGHNYEAEISVEVIFETDINGFIFPADLIKVFVDDRYDHKLIISPSDHLYVAITDFANDEQARGDDWIAVCYQGPPSTENLAAQIAEDIRGGVLQHYDDPDMDCKVEVTLRETPTIAATVVRTNNWKQG